MLWSVVGLAALLLLWSLLAGRFEKWSITPAMVLVLGGLIVGIATHDALAEQLRASIIEPIVEIVLAIVLFVHATSVRGGFFGGQAALTLRLLCLAMPLGLALTVLLGLWLLPGVSWAMLLVVACVVVPVDFAPVVSVLHDHRLSTRVRRLLNVEEGYADGIVAPVFLFALAVAGGQHTHAESVAHALAEGVPHLVVAVGVGIVVGAGVALAANAADRRGAMTDQARRLVVLVAPVLTYALSVGLHGNGFVAAFVCGIAFNGARRHVDAEREQELVDDVAFVLAGVVWFVFGAIVWFVLQDGVHPLLVVFSLLVLTVVRAVPVAIATLRSPLNRGERIVLAGLGPRGTATIVLALLAYVGLPDEPGQTLFAAALVVVLGSVVLHGIAAPLLLRRYAVEPATSAGNRMSG